jgi:DNA/RNA-binding domain of Phe-tRNA-synthetase-like protein
MSGADDVVIVRLDPEIASQVAAGIAWLSGLSAAENNPFWQEIEAVGARHRDEHSGRAPSEIAGLDPARRLYRSFGVDPTRTRPSSEALLRRVLQGRDLYQINRLVDAVNCASLELLLPIGLYDRDRLQGELVIRQGAPGEAYEGIRRGEIHLEGRLVVADAAGPCGSPTADSARTCVTPGTTRALAVILVPGDFPRSELADGVSRMAARIERWCGGHTEGQLILGGS